MKLHGWFFRNPRSKKALWIVSLSASVTTRRTRGVPTLRDVAADSSAVLKPSISSVTVLSAGGFDGPARAQIASLDEVERIRHVLTGQ